MFGVDIHAIVSTWRSFAEGIVLPKAAGYGVKVDPESPTFGYADLLGAIDIRGPAGGTSPSWAVYQAPLYQYSFGTAGGVTEVFINFHIPHDFAPGSDIFMHTHWSTIAAPTGDCNWLFNVSHAKGYGRGVFEGTAGSATPVIVSKAGTAATAFKHEITEMKVATSGGLVASAINVSITSGAANLTSASALFTAADIGKTIRVVGAGAAGGNLDTTITAFGTTQSVTVGNNASTTVTAQPNYRERIIDSDLIEIDSVLVCRVWRDAARTADTLNVAPFLHFADCHYQSNGVLGTKDKNYPFYV